MYIELDGDDVAVTYIKDVVFNANRQDVETLRMTKVSSESHFLMLTVLYAMFLTYSSSQKFGRTFPFT